MSEPEEYFLDGPDFIESSEFEETIGAVLERVERLEAGQHNGTKKATEQAEDEPEYIPAEDIRKQLQMSPIRFIDMLNGQNGLRLITSWEEWWRAGEYHLFETDKLKELTIHRLDLLEYLQKRDRQDEAVPPAVAADTPAIEAELAEAQKKIETLHEWNKRLHETNKRVLTEAQEKDTRVAELEKELAAVRAEPATTANAAKWESSVAAAFKVWADIVQGDKADWKEDEFRAALVKLCADYHTKVHNLAWRTLPDAFKSGRGRPKKKPEKSQQSDNS